MNTIPHQVQLAVIALFACVLIWLAWLWPVAMVYLLFGVLVLIALAGVSWLFAPLVVYLRRNGHAYLTKSQEIEHTRATVQVAPLAHTFAWHAQSSTPALSAPDIIDQIDVIKPMAEWMPWIDEQPHTLLGGKTKAGKTWLATALLERRIDSGCDIFIIDPHSSDWMGLPTAGGTGAEERRAALKAIFDEYNRRMDQRDEHKKRTGRELPHDYFDPLCVLVDESNALLEEQGNQWRGVLKQVASGSRKVSIGLLMLAQSPLVEDLGISGAMRENFSRIALDERTVQTLIDSERDKARKAALQAAFRTMERPAAATIGTQVWLLDRRGLSAGQASAQARIWAGWDFARGAPRVRVVVPEPPAELAQDAPTVLGGTGSGTTQDDDAPVPSGLEPLIKRMAAQGFSRNQMVATLGGNKQKTLAIIRTVLEGDTR